MDSLKEELKLKEVNIEKSTSKLFFYYLYIFLYYLCIFFYYLYIFFYFLYTFRVGFITN